VPGVAFQKCHRSLSHEEKRAPEIPPGICVIWPVGAGVGLRAATAPPRREAFCSFGAASTFHYRHELLQPSTSSGRQLRQPRRRRGFNATLVGATPDVEEAAERAPVRAPAAASESETAQ
jgi:hypothetical protein